MGKKRLSERDMEVAGQAAKDLLLQIDDAFRDCRASPRTDAPYHLSLKARKALAESIVGFAKNWMVRPGRSALKKRPLRLTCGGESKGKAILDKALDGATVDVVERELEDAAEQLADVHRFFLRVLKSFDGVAWNPPKIRGKEGKVPDPEVEALIKGYENLRDKEPTEQLSVHAIMDLYGLSEVTTRELTNSTKYVQGSGRQLKPWQLPRVEGRASLRERDGGRFASTSWWTATEVRRAMEGWAERLGAGLPGGPGPF